MDASRQRVNAWIRDDDEPACLHIAAQGETECAPAAVRAIKRRSAKPGLARNRRRRGVAALWLILSLPVLLLLLGVVIEIGNIWLARVELENSLEAAALAAVKEWGNAGGVGGTQIPRLVGVEYAAANTVTGSSVAIGTNWPGNAPNENADCAGNLIFGAVVTDAIPWVFDAGEQAGCGYGVDLLFDATSNPSMQGNNAWGINFDLQTSPTTPANLTIASVEYNLRTPGYDTDAYFDLLATSPVISTLTVGGATPPIYVSPNEQDDTYGLDSGSLNLVTVGTVYYWYNSQVEFVWDSAVSARHILTINFRNRSAPDPTIDFNYFQPGDRIRFGARVNNLSGQGTDNDGDSVGQSRVGVTVTFAIAGAVQPNAASGTFSDTDYGDTCNRGNKFDTPPADIDPCFAQPTAPNQRFVLPFSANNGNGNDDQSVLRLGSAGGGRAFAVRAQATAPVNSVCCRLFGTVLPVFQVSACATAMYDCNTQYPALIRVRPENYICP